MLKEVTNKKKNKEMFDIVGEKNADLGRAISVWAEESYMAKNEEEWLTRIKDEIRNKYLHSNVGSIAKGISLQGWEIRYITPKELLSILKGIRSGKIECHTKTDDWQRFESDSRYC